MRFQRSSAGLLFMVRSVIAAILTLDLKMPGVRVRVTFDKKIMGAVALQCGGWLQAVARAGVHRLGPRTIRFPKNALDELYKPMTLYKGRQNAKAG